ncbi:hypothetical protein Q3C67_08455 [Enterococcus faecium]|nr:hypothetical protein [Enterococcus faecium]MDQ8239905.1 hypothetical protein [Enterococcus faecium]
MKIVKLFFFNIIYLATVILYCGLLFSQLSISPRYQPYLMKLLHISAASMPLDIMKELGKSPFFVSMVLIIGVGISLLIYKKEGIREWN